MSSTLRKSDIHPVNKFLFLQKDSLFRGDVITQDGFSGFAYTKIYGNSPEEVVAKAKEEYPDLVVKE